MALTKISSTFNKYITAIWYFWYFFETRFFGCLSDQVQKCYYYFQISVTETFTVNISYQNKLRALNKRGLGNQRQKLKTKLFVHVILLFFILQKVRIVQILQLLISKEKKKTNMLSLSICKNMNQCFSKTILQRLNREQHKYAHK